MKDLEIMKLTLSSISGLVDGRVISLPARIHFGSFATVEIGKDKSESWMKGTQLTCSP
jgi:hypothetical protein